MVSSSHINLLRGGHWGILETAKPKKNSSKPKNRIQNCIPKQVQIGKKKKKEKPKTTLGTKTEKPLVFFYENRKPDAKKWKIRKPHWTPKPKSFDTKTENRKSQCPLFYQKTMQDSDDNDEVNETEEFDDKHYFLGSFCFIGVSGSCVIISPPLCVRLRISFLAVF